VRVRRVLSKLSKVSLVELSRLADIELSLLGLLKAGSPAIPKPPDTNASKDNVLSAVSAVSHHPVLR
jgi:hypothetical protein